MTYRIDVLNNGMRVASENIPHAHSAAFAIAINVGARHETEDEHGLSHLMEHMAFKGTSALSARDIAEKFDLMGGDINAYTSHEHTVYYVKVLKEYADDALALLCEIVADPKLDEDELAREKSVILQELAMHADSPDSIVFDYFQQTSFANQPLGRSILGTKQSVLKHTRQSLQAYLAKHYQAPRMVITAAGAIDHTRILACVEQAFSHLPMQDIIPPLVQGHYTCGHFQQHKALEQVQLLMGFGAVAASHADHTPLQVFSTLLGGGMSSRLFQEIRERLGLAYSVSSFMNGYTDCGVLGIYAACDHQQVTPLIAALEQVIASTAAPVGEEELLRAKNQLKASIVMSRESTSSVAEWIARHIHVYGRYRTADELLGEIDLITVDTMQQMVTRYMLDCEPSLTLYGPVKGLKPKMKPIPAHAA
jgi:predicted Zn-dependent peptidase